MEVAVSGMGLSAGVLRFKETHLIKALSLILAATFSVSAFAEANCTAQAAEKKLAGAAKTSFMKKCEADAAAKCDAAAADKKLAGAAKNSFAKKCVADAVGAS